MLAHFTAHEVPVMALFALALLAVAAYGIWFTRH